MSMRQRIEDKMHKKEQEIQEHENSIRDAKIYIEALKETLKMLPKEDNDVENQGDKIRPGSKIAKVYALLKKTGHPLHVAKLLEGIGEPNTKESRVSLSGSLGLYVRNQQIFNRPSPNTFGLRGLNSHSVNEPPDNFGLVQREIDLEGD